MIPTREAMLWASFLLLLSVAGVLARFDAEPLVVLLSGVAAMSVARRSSRCKA